MAVCVAKMAVLALASLISVYVISALTSIEGQSVEPLEYEILDDVRANERIGNVVDDADLRSLYAASVLPELRYVFLADEGEHQDYLFLDEHSGELSTHAELDRDVICAGASVCALQADIAVRPSEHTKLIRCRVVIADRNDNSPRFDQDVVTYELLESTSPGDISPLTTAHDPDSPSNGVVAYRLSGDSETFSLNVRNESDSFALMLHLNVALDREERDRYFLQVLAIDGGAPAHTGTMALEVLVLDVNDNSPQFETDANSAGIPENLDPGSLVYTVNASDPDIGQNGAVTYAFDSDTLTRIDNMFSIDSDTGQIRLIGRLDYEQRASYTLTVVARDGGQDSLPTTTRVTINVQDVNDNRPVIADTLPANRTVRINENNDPSQLVAHISVIDPDQGQNGHVQCFLNGDQGHFDIREVYDKEFQIFATTPLDYELIQEYELEILCQDYGPVPFIASERLTVRVIDVNDNAPEFSQETYYASIVENNQAQTPLVRVSAFDQESGGAVRYSVAPAAQDLFQIETLTGRVYTLRSFDRESEPMIQFRVLAEDSGTPAQTATATVIVELQDVNDNGPTFERGVFVMNVSEGLSDRALVGNVIARDPDDEPNNQFSYFLNGGESSAVDYFSIDPSSGYIYTKRSLDREHRDAYTLAVLVQSDDTPPKSDTAVVEITVLDVNDNRPVVTSPLPAPDNVVYVSNLAPIGYSVTRVIAYDNDSGQNARLQYQLLESTDTDTFRIDRHSGNVILERDVSHLNNEVVTLTIRVHDMGTPLQSAVATLAVHINSSAPLDHNNGEEANSRAPAAVKNDDGGGGGSTAVVVGAVCGAVIVLLVVVLLLVVLLLRRRKSSLERNMPLYVAQPSAPAKEDVIDFRESNGTNHGMTSVASPGHKNGGSTIPIKLGNGKTPASGNSADIEKERLKHAKSPPKSLKVSTCIPTRCNHWL